MIIILTQIQCAGLTPKPTSTNLPEINILLDEQEEVQLTFSGQFQIKSDEIEIKLPRNKSISFQVASNRTKKRTEVDKFYLLENDITLHAINSNQYVSYLDRSYSGSIHLNVNGSKIKIINSVDLETYVKGVVEKEIGNLGKTAPEALKAQAVAARTYGFKKINERDSDSQLFDVRSDVSDQVYSGFRKSGKNWIDVAVDKTWGEVIVYDNKVIHCFYHSTCGGRTESGENIFLLQSTPYLSGIADNFGKGDFCSSSPSYRWTETFSFSEIMPAIAAFLKQRGNSGRHQSEFTEFEVAQRFPSGRVKSLNLSSNNGALSVKIDSRFIRNLFRNNNQILRSTLFRLEPTNENNGKLTLIGAGNGHGVGMCQWGAIGMAKSGFNYRQILSHYYRNTEIKKIY